jgi:hypothetical protein
LVRRHQRLTRPENVPVVLSAEQARDREHGPAEAVAVQYGQRILDEVGVAVVEGQPDETAPGTLAAGGEKVRY